jgi:hypothetical protein
LRELARFWFPSTRPISLQLCLRISVWSQGTRSHCHKTFEYSQENSQLKEWGSWEYVENILISYLKVCKGLQNFLTTPPFSDIWVENFFWEYSKVLSHWDLVNLWTPSKVYFNCILIYSIQLLIIVIISVVTIVADYRKIITECWNQRKSIIDFLHRLSLAVLIPTFITSWQVYIREVEISNGYVYV